MLEVMARELAARPECEVRAIVLNYGLLHDRLKSLGIQVCVLPESRLGVIKLFQAITAELRHSRCDILHTHRYKENILGALAASSAGVPLCIRTVHGSPEPFRGVARARMIIYLLLDRLVQRRLNDRVIVVADCLKTEMRSWLREEKIVVIHNGLPGGIVGIRRERKNQDRFVVGWAGRMVPAKSLDLLLDAVARLRSSIPYIKVRLAGDGPDAKRLEDLTVSLGLRDLVEFCGFVTDIAEFLSTLDVFILPSSQEAFPVSLLEAMRAGVPVVASSVGGIPEVINHRTSGILISPGDLTALRAALQELATDASLRDRLGRAGKDVVVSRFSSQHLARELVALYTRLWEAKKDLTATSPRLLE